MPRLSKWNRLSRECSPGAKSELRIWAARARPRKWAMRFWKNWASAALIGLALASGVVPAGPGWKHSYAVVNDVRLHYVEQGTGPLILFLHGFPEFWYSWKDLLPEFARDHHAVALDMRGYNLSAKPEAVDAYRVPVIVEDVRALAEKLKARKFILVGH